jgi:hypothetical protein
MKLVLYLILVLFFVSCFQQREKIPDSIKVEVPVSSSSEANLKRPVLFFLIDKDEHVYYKYDSSKFDQNLTEIKPVNIEEISEAIALVEKKYPNTLGNGDILLKLKSDRESPIFKMLKTVLKEKNYYKFKIVQQQNNY